MGKHNYQHEVDQKPTDSHNRMQLA